MLRRTPLRRKKSLNKISPTKGHKRFIPKSVLKALRERSGGQCEMLDVCHAIATDPHHVLPRSRGGKHTLCNLLHLCRYHHSKIHDNVAWARQMGYTK